MGKTGVQKKKSRKCWRWKATDREKVEWAGGVIYP